MGAAALAAALRRLRHLSFRSTLERLARQGLPSRLMAAQLPCPQASTPSSSASVSLAVLPTPRAPSAPAELPLPPELARLQGRW